MGIFAKIAAGLKKTKDSFLGRLKRIFNSFTKIDEELFEQLEEAMIMSDIGVETSEEICDRLRKTIKERGITDPNEIMDLIQEIIADMMGDDTGLDLTKSPAIIMVIGVNGAGKTTTIGKLCYQFKNEGKKVIVAAADTFRAAAIDQLEVWTERAGVEIVKHAEGSDPGAVVYDALEAAKARECDVVIIDTAGRLHNKKNLMEELAKINRIIDKKSEECSREVLLVLDATTGQNAVNQAKLFSETAPITGIVLTKLDGTAKGGIVISIKNELGIPVKLIGVGEKIDDLQPFDSHTFVEALFSDTELDAEDETDEELEEAEGEENTEESEYEDDSEYDEEYESEDDAEEDDDDDDDEDAAEAEKAVYEYYGQPSPDIFSAKSEPDFADKYDFSDLGADVSFSFGNANAPAEAVSEPDEEEEENTAAENMTETSDEPEYGYEPDAEDEEDEEADAAESEDTEDEDTEEDTEAEEEIQPEPEKKKKRGFFSRLFGRKKSKDEDEEEDDDEASEDEDEGNEDE